MTPTLHRGWVITPNGRKGGGAWVMTPPPERNELGTTAVEGFEKEIIEKKVTFGFRVSRRVAGIVRLFFFVFFCRWRGAERSN